MTVGATSTSIQPIRRVRAVVVNYNGGAFIGRAIQALQRTDTPRTELDIVVVDNASTDGSADKVAADFPEVRLIRSSTNLGFSGGNNLALTDLAGIDAVALVNSDCFVTPDWLLPLIDVLERDPKVGAVSPKILFDGPWRQTTITSPTFSPGNGDGRTLGVRVYHGSASMLFGDGCSHPEDGYRWTDQEQATVYVHASSPPTLRLAADSVTKITVDDAPTIIGPEPTDVAFTPDVTVEVINNAGNSLDEKWWGAERGFLETDLGQYDVPSDIAAWCGACVLLRTSYLADVGLFDERFFLYFEDTDLSLRGTAKGWRHRYEPASAVRHGHGLSTSTVSALTRFCSERNRLVVIARYAPKPVAARLWMRALRDAVATLNRRDQAEASLRFRSIAGAIRIVATGTRRLRPAGKRS